MSNTLTSPAQVARICKSKSLLLVLLCCIIPFSLIFMGFSSVSDEQLKLWQNMQYHMVLFGFSSLVISYWMLLFRPNYILSLLVKEKIQH